MQIKEMRRLLASATLMLSVVLAMNSHAEEFTVFGKWKDIGDEASHQDADEPAPSVKVARTVTNEDGQPVELVLATGAFSDGSVILEGEIDEPSNVIISVNDGGDEPLTLNAVVEPHQVVSFALLNYASAVRKNRLLLVGRSVVVEDSTDKFTILGSLDSIFDKDLSLAEAYVDGVVSASVLLLQDRFLIEGIVNEPSIATVGVRTPDYDFWGVVDVVVEPGATIMISPSTSSSSFNPNRASELMANSASETSMHAKVIESWQNSEEYLAKLEEYAVAIRNAPPEPTSGEGEQESQDATDSVDDSVVDPYDVYKEMEAIMFAGLTAIAENLEEPMAALLATEIGARHWMAKSRQLETWNRLAAVLEPDLVERRVIPQRVALEKRMKVSENAKSIVEGEIAPEFTLANLEGEEVELYDVLGQNEVLLVDFWASWCGPCIATIPKLKELYSAYKDEGFEIVFVSIDEAYDDWETISTTQELPWINLGDLNGFLAPTAVDYGVQWIPTEFVVDPSGEVLDREVSMEELEQLLAERFGDTNHQEDAEDLNPADQNSQ